jgi:hypothetical protein
MVHKGDHVLKQDPESIEITAHILGEDESHKDDENTEKRTLRIVWRAGSGTELQYWAEPEFKL